jgi:NDP-sugar pyrophosphorylase family protein
LKYKHGDECFLCIGNNNEIREFCSIHRSSKPSDKTVIGDNNLIMGSCHIAHDCKIGDRNIFANNTLLAGHVVVEVRFSLCLYSKPGFSSVVLFGLCCECRTIHTQQEPRWSTSSVILALLLSLAVVLW